MLMLLASHLLSADVSPLKETKLRLQISLPLSESLVCVSVHRTVAISSGNTLKRVRLTRAFRSTATASSLGSTSGPRAGRAPYL